ncbi:Bax inhibitor-1/YccA family protein [Aliikangiella maris]|uniref:Bax inhibitor-1/YccA family protein n=2 Tax=Aliikangiella maris TaxID=3162458 RepID=A0ABV3MUK4_9GAMM
MQPNSPVIERTHGRSIEINKVLKNTYMLLGATISFSALVAYFAAVMNLPHPGFIITLVGFYGLLFVIHKTQNSASSIFWVFALTGFMGYTLGPIVGMLSNTAPQILVQALAGTGLIFFGLSAWVLLSKKDFSFLSGAIAAGFWVLIIAVIASLIFDISGLSLAISAGFMIFSSMIILYQTSEIVRGGETNYVMATVTLFVSLYNIFVSLLNLLMAFGGDD